MDVSAFLPAPELFVPFMVAGVALNLTPGSDMTFVALAGARGGRHAGLAAAAGIFVGCLGHIAFAVVGLSALIAASQTAFTVVKWVGVAYLLFLAVQLLRQKGTKAGGSKQRIEFRPLRAFRQAAVVNLLNPKVGIFFLAFLPQFIEPDAPSPGLQILALGIIFNTTGLLVNALVGSFSAAVASRLGGSPRLGQFARWFAATVLGGLAVKLAVSRNE